MSNQRLFVDCDDTLILFDSEGEIHPFGFWRDDPYRINEPLVVFIRQFRKENPEGFIVIWSGGGQEYATQVVREVNLEDVTAWHMIKDKTTFHLVREGDIVIDDMDIEVPVKVLRPDAPEITGTEPAS